MLACVRGRFEGRLINTSEVAGDGGGRKKEVMWNEK